MFKHGWIFLYLVITIGYVTTGCKKEPEVIPEPVVELITPAENQVFSTFDTVFIKANISHNIPISTITLSITDTDLKPVVSGKSIDPGSISSGNNGSNSSGSNSYFIDDYLVIDNKYITGSENFLQIRIEVGQEMYRNWYTIGINPLTRQLDDVLVVSGNLNANKLYSLKQRGEAELLWSWNSEYIGGYADSRNSMFYTSGSLISGITGYDLKERNVAWSVPAVSNGSLPYFTAFTSVDGSIATGISEGLVESYNSAGLKILATPKYQGGVFTRVMHFNNHIVAVFSPYSTSQNTFMVFNNPAGNLFASINFTGQIVDILNISTNRIFLIINQDGINKAYEYDMNTNGLVFMHNVTAEPIHIISGNGTDYFISTPTSVFWYKPLSGSVYRFLTTSGITAIAFDEISNTLYAAEGATLNTYSLPNSTPAINHVFDEPVKDIKLIYNK